MRVKERDAVAAADDALAHSDLTGPPMRWLPNPHQPPDIPRLLGLQVLDLLQSPHLSLLRQCQGPGCGWRWCSSSDCGNRARARRHYARHREQPMPRPPTPTQHDPSDLPCGRAGGRPQ